LSYKVSVGWPTPRKAESGVGNPTPGRDKGRGLNPFGLDRPLHCSRPCTPRPRQELATKNGA
jgi:hypothetical protein